MGLYYKEEDVCAGGEIFVLNFLLLLHLMICMQVTLEGLWVGEMASFHKRNELFPFFGSCGLCVFWPFIALPFCLPFDGSGHLFLLDFFVLIDSEGAPHNHESCLSAELFRFKMFQ